MQQRGKSRTAEKILNCMNQEPAKARRFNLWSIHTSPLRETPRGMFGVIPVLQITLHASGIKKNSNKISVFAYSSS